MNRHYATGGHRWLDFDSKPVHADFVRVYSDHLRRGTDKGKGSMKDVRITKKSDGTWGLSMTDGLFDWAEDGTQVAQHVTIRWNIFAKTKTDPGEYTLNNELPHKTDLGTKWYTVILDSKKSRAEKDFELKRVAMATTGVKQITKWNWTQTGHAVSIVGAGWTEWGEVDFSGDITPL